MDSNDQAGLMEPGEGAGWLAAVITWVTGLVDSTVGVVLIYFCVTWAGITFGAHIAHSNVIWPANGVLLGILLFSRRRKWARFLFWTCVVSAAFHVVSGFNPGRSITYALANVAEIYPAAAFIRWGEDRRPDLTRPKVLLRFLIATLAAPLLSRAL